VAISLLSRIISVIRMQMYVEAIIKIILKMSDIVLEEIPSAQ
jgi:hypothetical protein